MKKYKSFTKRERVQLEALLRAKVPVKEICIIMNRHNSTIYREIKRGQYQHLNGQTWLFETRYSADKAQADAEYNNLSKGRSLKIGKDHAFAAYIADEIQKKHSPAVALANIERSDLHFATKITLRTLYSYIDKGLIYGVTNKDLWIKGKKKKRKHRHPHAKALPRGNSIDARPKEIAARGIFGHWELDSMIGTRKKGETILALIERKTRFLLLWRAKGKTAAECVRFLDGLEGKACGLFPLLFKSITVDNGCEFADYIGMETTPKTGVPRTKVYYCHPYCSSERGTNENHNGFVRRFVPKGTKIESVPDKTLHAVQEFINTYPRQILAWSTPRELFESELSKIGIKDPKIFLENFCNTY